MEQIECTYQRFINRWLIQKSESSLKSETTFFKMTSETWKKLIIKKVLQIFRRSRMRFGHENSVQLINETNMSIATSSIELYLMPFLSRFHIHLQNFGIRSTSLCSGSFFLGRYIRYILSLYFAQISLIKLFSAGI